MNTVCRILSLVALATIIVTGNAQAAVLTTAGDTAHVDSGNGFKPVPNRSTVQPGSVVSVGRNGRATLTYENGCAFTIRAGRLVTVPREPPPCAGQDYGQPKSMVEKVVGLGGTATVFGIIIYKATRPSSP